MLKDYTKALFKMFFIIFLKAHGVPLMKAYYQLAKVVVVE